MQRNLFKMCDVPPIFLQEELHSLKIETKKSIVMLQVL
jgi:hypothetical protein